MNSEIAERQLETLSQAVELLLHHSEEHLSPAERRIFQLLREELLGIREERQRMANDLIPEQLQPPLENVHPGQKPEAGH